MIELYSIRHGIAVKSNESIDDKTRSLTEEGIQKTQKVARRFCEIGLRFDTLLTSPLVRARQTAEILQQAGLSKQVEEFLALAPEGDFQAWLSWYSQRGYNGKKSRIALVGHQPDLGNWAEILLWGSARSKLILKKAGAIGLKLPEKGTPVGKSQLFLLTSPKWLL